ncbi:hypothetical protein, partial [Actinosynnema sp. NPDC000082]
TPEPDPRPASPPTHPSAPGPITRPGLRDKPLAGQRAAVALVALWQERGHDLTRQLAALLRWYNRDHGLEFLAELVQYGVMVSDSLKTKAVDQVKTLLDRNVSPNEWHRWAHVLMALSSERVLDLMLDLAGKDETEEEPRYNAVRFAYQLSPERARPEVRAFLKDRKVSRVAKRTLLAMLVDSDREAALRLCENIAEKAKHSSTCLEAIDLIDDHDSARAIDTWELVATAWCKQDERLRLDAAIRVLERDSERGVALLVNLIGILKDRAVRWEAVDIWPSTRQGDLKVALEVYAYDQSLDLVIRYEASYLLAIGFDGDVGVLLKMAADKELPSHLRWEAARFNRDLPEALGIFNDVILSFSPQDPSVISSIAELGKLHYREAVKHLVRLARDPKVPLTLRLAAVGAEFPPLQNSVRVELYRGILSEGGLSDAARLDLLIKIQVADLGVGDKLLLEVVLKRMGGSTLREGALKAISSREGRFLAWSSIAVSGGSRSLRKRAYSAACVADSSRSGELALKMLYRAAGSGNLREEVRIFGKRTAIRALEELVEKIPHGKRGEAQRILKALNAGKRP